MERKTVMEPQSVLAAIRGAVISLLGSPADDVAHDTRLAPLLAGTQARAVGCWRHESGVLELVGFLAVDEMPLVIQAEFVAATWRVPLSAMQFGIAQAVAADGPAVNHRATEPVPATAGSIGWLSRLEAASSLAVPLRRGTELVGALATATVRRIEPDDDVWRLMTESSRLPEP